MGSFKKYRVAILVSLAIFVAMTAVMLLLSSGPQNGGFIYQIH